MSRVAFATFGILRQAPGNEQVQGFIDRLQSVLESAEATEGFIDRARLELDWGDRGKPRFFDEDKYVFAATTLSLWVDLESVYAFAYNGNHSEALSRREDWFLTPQWPTYVAWWVSDDHTPAWEEAWQRLEHLHDYVPSPYAFDYRKTFGDDGQEVRLRRQTIQTRITSVRLRRAADYEVDPEIRTGS